jgi:hypothetical protein
MSPPPHRSSNRTLRPSVQPKTASACVNAETKVFAPGSFSSRRHEHADAPHAVALLRPRRERPSDRRAAESSDKFAPSKANGHLPLPCRGCPIEAGYHGPSLRSQDPEPAPDPARRARARWPARDSAESADDSSESRRTAPLCLCHSDFVTGFVTRAPAAGEGALPDRAGEPERATVHHRGGDQQGVAPRCVRRIIAPLWGPAGTAARWPGPAGKDTPAPFGCVSLGKSLERLGQDREMREVLISCGLSQLWQAFPHVTNHESGPHGKSVAFGTLSPISRLTPPFRPCANGRSARGRKA